MFSDRGINGQLGWIIAKTNRSFVDGLMHLFARRLAQMASVYVDSQLQRTRGRST
jgi:hypothetical protein